MMIMDIQRKIMYEKTRAVTDGDDLDICIVLKQHYKS